MKHPFDDSSDVLSTRVVEDGEVVVLELAGEVDMMTADEPLAEALKVLDRAPAGLAVDLRAVSFFASSGINLLLTVQERAQVDGVPVAVVADQPAVLRPLAMTGVDRELALFTARSDALVALHGLPGRGQAGVRETGA
ncbi:STAS domain-containing protein [Lentzea sp. NPDC003310]|uniref:STAS domain-containing protein n=1 Tax=Lentzea sp. NPDC003310 TaxID=3154447 RepID=UPI0033A92AC6